MNQEMKQTERRIYRVIRVPEMRGRIYFIVIESRVRP